MHAKCPQRGQKTVKCDDGAARDAVTGADGHRQTPAPPLRHRRRSLKIERVIESNRRRLSTTFDADPQQRHLTTDAVRSRHMTYKVSSALARVRWQTVYVGDATAGP